MSIAIRLMAGFALGFEVNAAPGIYLCVYFGIAEIAFYNEEEMEDD
ncbi:hypothetical protein UFOVP337_20 [uncultured Caudovirales phage]|uniref:Uncharacterized protein n=1 Tax=uncultured Caudovirales phage TaxID=2100421 RepID=A0A6J5M1H8_9CAUD|nr:hypothetical protein UFOVP337_20 [uncultured Caudovirales phage]